MSWEWTPGAEDVPRAVAPATDPAGRFVPRREIIAPRPRAETAQVGALQLLPLLVPVLALGSVLFSRGWSLTNVAIFALLTAVIQGIVARRDRRILDSRGFVELPTSAWALVSPILYLRRRGRACEGHAPDAAIDWKGAAVSTGVAVAVILIATWFHAAIGEGLAVVSENL